MTYNAQVQFKFDSTWTPSYSSSFSDDDFIPEEHYLITAPAADLNAKQYFKLFEKFMLCVGMDHKSIRSGAMSLVFNDWTSEEEQRKVCKEYELTMNEDLEEKFKGKTSKILTLNTLSSKLCIKESGKVVAEKQESEMNDVSSYIPKLFGQVKSLEEAVTESEKFAEWVSTNQEVYKIALKLQNLNKNKGVHPSGLLLAHSLLEESCPVELSSDKQVVSSYDMNNVTAYNIKLDLLGLRGVSVVDDVCKSLGIRYEDIDVNDVFIYQQLQDFKLPHGLFQIEAETNFKVCQKVKPKNLEQLSGVLALARPGALQFIDKYANYTNNNHYESIHPFFDDILGVTGGVCLYQEQLMKMVSKVGFSLDEAEIVRRCVGKKKVEEMKEWEQKIKDKISQQKLDPKIGEVLWRIANDSANYQFNKSHSVSYAALAAISIYLKFKYPQQFFLSLLKMSKHEPDSIGEISKTEKELTYFNIKLLPPHLLKSKEEFCIEGDNIRFGLLSVKGISEKTIKAVNEFRGEFKSRIRQLRNKWKQRFLFDRRTIFAKIRQFICEEPRQLR